MSNDDPSDARAGTSKSAEIERREALIKLGKYAAYATPVLLASVTSKAAAPPPPVGSGAHSPPAPTPVP